MRRVVLILTLAFVIGACGRPQEAGTAPVPSDTLQSATSEDHSKDGGNSDRRFLAYAYDVSVDVDADQFEHLYSELQDVCLKETAWHCTILDANIRFDRGMGNGSAHLSLRASTEAVHALRARLAGSGDVVSQHTRVENLGQPVAEVDKRRAMLQSYRTKLLELQGKASKVEDLILIAQKIAETQAELEAANSQYAQLIDKVDRESLTVELSTRQTATRKLWEPVSSAFHEFFPTLLDASAGMIVALAHMLPWLLMLFMLALPVSAIRRKWNKRKNRTIEKTLHGQRPEQADAVEKPAQEQSGCS